MKKNSLTMIKNYESVFHYLARRTEYYCPIGIGEFRRMDRVDYLYHCTLPKTEVTKKMFPLFIDSMLNLETVRKENLDAVKFEFDVVKAYDIANKYERFLERHPKICRFVNGGFKII